MTNPALEARFVSLLREHRGILFKILRAYSQDIDSRRDLEQEITVQLWRSFARYDERLRFSTWMYRIALNVAISHFRSESRRLRHIVPADAAILEVADESAADPPTDHNLARLYGFIDRLDVLDRALILLYLDENSYAQIAEVLGISESNVGTKLNRIKQRLKRELAQDDK